MMTESRQSQEFRDALNDSARLLSQNRPGEAVQRLEPLYAEAPEDPDVAINLSGAYILQRKWDKAVRVLDEAVKANPDNAMLWTNLGAARLGRLEMAGPKQQERAIEAYWQALKADPYAPNVHYHLGLIYKERGEITRASAMFQRAVEVNPADLDARFWLTRLATAGPNEADGGANSDSVSTEGGVSSSDADGAEEVDSDEAAT